MTRYKAQTAYGTLGSAVFTRKRSGLAISRESRDTAPHPASKCRRIMYRFAKAKSVVICAPFLANPRYLVLR